MRELKKQTADIKKATLLSVTVAHIELSIGLGGKFGGLRHRSNIFKEIFRQKQHQTSLTPLLPADVPSNKVAPSVPSTAQPGLALRRGFGRKLTVETGEGIPLAKEISITSQQSSPSHSMTPEEEEGEEERAGYPSPHQEQEGGAHQAAEGRSPALSIDNFSFLAGRSFPSNTFLLTCSTLLLALSSRLYKRTRYVNSEARGVLMHIRDFPLPVLSIDKVYSCAHNITHPRLV